VNTLTSPADNGRVAGRHMNDALLEREPEAVDQLIARVLRQAHTTADTLDEPNQARAILHLAQFVRGRAGHHKPALRPPAVY
jgi:hypothetical protein